MKFEDVKVGMHLRDPTGNVWKIIDISAGNIPCVYARCIDFVHPVGVIAGRLEDAAEAAVGRWLYVDKTHLIIAPDSVTQQFKNYSATGQRCINVVTGLNKTKTLCFVTQEQYDGIEVTLNTLEPIPEPQHLTRENIRVGIHVRTALDAEFIVIGYTDTLVQLLYNATFNCKGKQLKQATAKIYIDWADVPNIPAEGLTTDDFTVVE